MSLPDQRYIGRGEVLSQKIIWKLLSCVEIYEQVNITKLITLSELKDLDPEILKHNFDFVIKRPMNKPDIVVEVNYGHKEKAAKKWRLIFVPLLKKYGYDFMTIDDYDCRSSLPGEKGLFHLNSKKEHEPSWNDWRDIIDSLEKAGIKPQ